MKSVTSTLIADQEKTSAVYKRTIYLSKRSSDGASWDAPIDITPLVKQVGKITWQLDTDGLNVWKLSNCTLVVKNENNEWKDDNDLGLFSGKQAYNSKIDIKAGQMLPDGTFEQLYIFRGVITDIMTDSKSATAQIVISGLESLLGLADAENVSTLVTGENIGTGDGLAGPFGPTTHPGVGVVKAVYVAGTLMEPGRHYKVEQLNDKTQGATITFNAGYYPTTGQAVTISYTYWYQNETIDYLVKKLLDEAGVASYEVNPVVFDNDVLYSWLQSEQTDFEASGNIRTRVDTSTAPGEIRLQWNVLDTFIPNGSFEAGLSQWSHTAGFYTDTSVKRSGNQSAAAQLYSAGDPGDSGTLVCNILDPQAGDGIVKQYVLNKQSGWTLVTSPAADLVGYIGANLKIQFVMTFALGYGTQTQSITSNAFAYTGGDLTGYYIFTTHTESGPTRRYYNVWLDDIAYVVNNYSANGSYTSPALDCGTSLKHYSKLNYTSVVPSNVSLYAFTQSSDDGLSWTEPFVQLASDGTIQSAVKRYIRVRFDFYTTYWGATPHLLDFTLNYATSSITISLADFTGMTIQQAIGELAAMADYEMGFRAEDGVYFFRSKSPSTAIAYNFTEDKNLVSISNNKPGWDKVFNWVSVSYGKYTKDMSPDTEGESAPNSFTLYGKRKLSLSGGSLALDDSVDLATGVAMRYYGRYKLPKKTWRVLSKFIPQIDLSDTVRCNLLLPGDKRAYTLWGDGTLWGSGALYTSGNDGNMTQPEALYMPQKDGKVVGLVLDPEAWTLEADIKAL